MDKKQANPNLRNFLSAVNELYCFNPRLSNQYFKDLKEVRDKLTHNNPRKRISDVQEFNSYSLINYFFIKTFAKIMSIENIKSTLVLKPLS